ncbi:ATV_HP_G0159030.mRNA.1.CDS.1 [Saccharomyces cerevisiae]|nr:ATV_HP_G0159030.mRNA.1.CDS.1 [Saccharomyces cerevisiae]CAI6938366.1 ATV_HP_G0159030.mRNA.1.CDS.1 [Saccharomyces cerevisiae]
MVQCQGRFSHFRVLWKIGKIPVDASILLFETRCSLFQRTFKFLRGPEGRFFHKMDMVPTKVRYMAPMSFLLKCALTGLLLDKHVFLKRRIIVLTSSLPNLFFVQMIRLHSLMIQRFLLHFQDWF